MLLFRPYRFLTYVNPPQSSPRWSAFSIRRSLSLCQRWPRGAAISRLVTSLHSLKKEVHVDAEPPDGSRIFEKSPPYRSASCHGIRPSGYDALLNGFGRGTIYATDLQSPSPRITPDNTPGGRWAYRSPWMAALHAALKPTQTDYLYLRPPMRRDIRVLSDV